MFARLPMTVVVIAVLSALGVALTSILLRADSPNVRTMERRPEKPQTTLVIAIQALRFGTLIEPSVLKEIEWASDAIPEGAFRRIEDVLPYEQKRHVLSALAPNEPILASGITGPGPLIPTMIEMPRSSGRIAADDSSASSVTLEEGRRAVTIRVEDILGVADLVQPGHEVDVMLTRSKNGSPSVDVLLRGVKLLAKDQPSSGQAERPLLSRSVTLEVDVEQAQKLALGAHVGQLSLAAPNTTENCKSADCRINVNEPTPQTRVIRQRARKIRTYRGMQGDFYRRGEVKELFPILE